MLEERGLGDVMLSLMFMTDVFPKLASLQIWFCERSRDFRLAGYISGWPIWVSRFPARDSFSRRGTRHGRPWGGSSNWLPERLSSFSWDRCCSDFFSSTWPLTGANSTCTRSCQQLMYVVGIIVYSLCWSAGSPSTTDAFRSSAAPGESVSHWYTGTGLFPSSKPHDAVNLGEYPFSIRLSENALSGKHGSESRRLLERLRSTSEEFIHMANGRLQIWLSEALRRFNDGNLKIAAGRTYSWFFWRLMSSRRGQSVTMSSSKSSSWKSTGRLAELSRSKVPEL